MEGGSPSPARAGVAGWDHVACGPGRDDGTAISSPKQRSRHRPSSCGPAVRGSRTAGFGAAAEHPSERHTSVPINEHFHLRWLYLTGTINSHSNLCSQGERCGAWAGLGEDGGPASPAGLHSLILITHSFTQSFIHSVTHPSLTHSCSHSHPHSLIIHAATSSLTHSLIHAATHPHSSLTHSFTHSFSHLFTPLSLQKSLGGCRSRLASLGQPSWACVTECLSPQPLSLYYKDHLYFELLDLGQTARFSVFPWCCPILPTRDTTV